MKNRRIIFILLAVLLVGLLVFCFTGPTEPTYKGRKLTSYLRGPWEQIDGPQTDNPHFGPDIVAIRAIGTNGIPTLLRLIQAHDPPWKAKMISFLNRQKIIHLDIRDARRRRELGIEGFYILAELARPAVPELVRLTENSEPEIRGAALQSLNHIPVTKEVFQPVLERLCHDINKLVKIIASECYYQYYPFEAQRARVRNPGELIWESEIHGDSFEANSTATNPPAAK
jgi:hypothetical protein